MATGPKSRSQDAIDNRLRTLEEAVANLQTGITVANGNVEIAVPLIVNAGVTLNDTLAMPNLATTDPQIEGQVYADTDVLTFSHDA